MFISWPPWLLPIFLDVVAHDHPALAAAIIAAAEVIAQGMFLAAEWIPDRLLLDRRAVDVALGLEGGDREIVAQGFVSPKAAEEIYKVRVGAPRR